jgi:selenocysteine-specific elongation factor
MRVVCTAGHVDHGKSSLVRAISGINPDRLREEIEREMTIDLGFAWVTLPNGEPLGIVDVPGHEDFIENMLAGVGGLDAFILIVAADEGVMPQTREHFSILQLMGMNQGVVALTKIDAAEDAEWIELVELDVVDLLNSAGMGHVPIVRVSAHTGEGLGDLLQVLLQVLEDQPERVDLGKPVLPVDRVFTMSGFGTVVTGTLSDGVLAVGQTVEFQPSGREARIRGLQSHNQSVEVAYPGSRVAVNLSGVDKNDIRRGDVLALPGFIHPTVLFDATLRHLQDAARPLKHNAEVKVFVGPSESLARVRLLDADELRPGQVGYVQFELQTPLPIRNHQRFVMRIPSPSETIGGGIVLETAPGQKWKRHREEVIERFEVLAHGDPVMQLVYELKTKRVPQPVDSFDDPDLLAEAMARFGLLQIDSYVAHPDAIRQLGERAARILDAFHQANPLLVGMDAGELLRQLHLKESDGAVLLVLKAAGVIEFDRLVSLPGRGMNFTRAQRRAADELMAAFDADPYSPPSFKDAVKLVGEGVLKALLTQGELIYIKPDVLLRPAEYQALIDYARQRLEAGEVLTVRDLRDYFDTSRRIALPFLDFLEAQGITKRKDEGHILRESKWDVLFR